MADFNSAKALDIAVKLVQEAVAKGVVNPYNSFRAGMSAAGYTMPAADASSVYAKAKKVIAEEKRKSKALLPDLVVGDAGLVPSPQEEEQDPEEEQDAPQDKENDDDQD